MEESFACLAGCAVGLGGGLAGDAFQKKGCWLVGWVLGDQLTTKGFCQGGGGQTLHRFPRGGETGFDPVGEGEQGFDAADDFLLFGEGGKIEREAFELPEVDPGARSTVHILTQNVVCGAAREAEHQELRKAALLIDPNTIAIRLVDCLFRP